MEPCNKQIAADLWGANWGKKGRPHTERRPLSDTDLEKLPPFCVNGIVNNTKAHWISDIDGVKEAIAERQEILRIEMHDRLWVLEAAIDEIEKEIDRRRANPTDAKLQTITSNYRPRTKRLQEECELTKRCYEIRIDMLQKSVQHIEAPERSSVHLQCTAVIDMEYDPVPLPLPLPLKNTLAEKASLTASTFSGGIESAGESQMAYIPRKPR